MSEDETNSKSPSRPAKRRRRLLVIIALLLLGGLWWLRQPSYLELTVPATPNPVGCFWWETQYSELRYADEPGALFLLRQVGSAYSSNQGWQTASEAMGFFDNWLRERGWEERNNVYSEGDPIIPESRYLSQGTGFRIYTRPGDEWADGPRIAVAIQPVPETHGHDVIFVTAKPSWLRRLSNAFDD